MKNRCADGISIGTAVAVVSVGISIAVFVNGRSPGEESVVIITVRRG